MTDTAAPSSIETARESHFEIDELFFSRTDTRGIILSGNGVFQRVSKFGWDELVNKPHKIIRHPDMPKAVFFLLWDFLKKGKPIGAYVKNRAKDGSYYWVFAIATPAQDGFLSVRLKPSTELLAVVEAQYDALRDIERSKALSSAESAALLLETLKGLGFASYDDFMSVAIGKEFAARNQAMGRPRDPTIANFEAMLASSQVLLAETEAILACFQANRYVPLNLQVLSAQLGPDGRAIGVISEDYGRVSDEIQHRIGEVTRSSAALFRKVYEVNFLLCTAQLQEEVTEVFAAERSTDLQNRDIDSAYLDRQRADYHELARDGLIAVIEQIETLQENCREMRRLATSLDVIRIMGTVSSAGLSLGNTVFDGLMNDLKLFQATVSDRLRKVQQIGLHMEGDTRKAVLAIAA
uniref:Putative PAS/PAC sensor protein n=1 Tax=Rhodopseudomonas palustris (strain BisA53) TaxID=316055 RepID=Q07K07_RHOP5